MSSLKVALGILAAGLTLSGCMQSTTYEATNVQNFKPREIGSIKVDRPGRHTLSIKPKTKAASAIVDIRQVTLKPK